MAKSPVFKNTKPSDIDHWVLVYQRRLELLEQIKDFTVENNPGNEYLEQLLDELEEVNDREERPTIENIIVVKNHR